GTRATETDHNPAGNTAQDTTTTYTYPAATAARPHSLTGTSAVTGGTGTPVTQTYDYDTGGNTTGRHLKPTGNQTLTWNTEGKLEKVTDGGKATDYVYDAGGNRILAHTADSAAPAAENWTLYLGNSELKLVKGAAKPVATRYYAIGTATAVRTDDGKVVFQLADHHGTAELNIDATTGAVDQRRTTPFGEARGTAPTSWSGNRGFVGGTNEATGLTHLGARDYDPATGRFISVDLILDVDDPQQWNGYVYSHNNPVNRSDPGGLYDPDERASRTRANSGTDFWSNLTKLFAQIADEMAAAAEARRAASQGYDRTTRHNQAVAVAVDEIKKQVKSMGVKNFTVETKYNRIDGANKDRMYPNYKQADSTYGLVDILGYDADADVYYVWEVKSASEAASAVPEAQWYVSRLKADGKKAVLGWTIGGPYDVHANGDKVIGPAEGAVIYGKPNDRDFKRISTSSPAAVAAQQAAQRVPSPSPGPGPGEYAGTVYQPGLGTRPLGPSVGGPGALLVVPFVVIGAAGVVAALPEEAAAAGAVATVAAASALFDLAA
ncbi:RHS repeat-associated core domain-containing protein, partial [Kitasatospora sp. NPDC049258]|uniref:RHS repeat-associated core domain-containing protein n=1 Tax=Kitasatospora sp. NPDC049258 TaxID=3155394 RepID=UPI00341D1CF9